MAQGGAVGSAGTTDTKVERIEEGATLATVANPNASPATHGAFDAGKAAGAVRERPSAVIDTTETGRLDLTANVKRGQPSAW
jgi:hypothetical protein